ncbi:MAG: YfhO family protein, partial [Ignavibacteria bacterium]|nr:YfhO family protein [Ignavibacteria bacterium]
ATVKLIDNKPNHLVYNASTTKESFVVFSEIWYSLGWKAYINGKEQPLIRANYVLRALKVPAGNSTIEMKFEPKVWAVGEKISLASSALLILLLIFWIASEIKRMKAAKAE